MMTSEDESAFEFVHQDIKRMRKIRKRFSLSLNDKSSDSVAVYIRLKPIMDSENSHILSFDNISNTLTIKKKTLEKMYKFTHIFGPETSQKQMFDECAMPYVKEFIEGERNVFMFTYGASSSGKTYTMLGEPGNPGFLPRIIGVLLKSLDGSLDTKTSLYPEQGCRVAELTPRKLNENCSQKLKLLSLSKSLVDLITKNRSSFVLSEMEDLKNESDKVNIPKGKVIYSLWFSYYEIYNEQVFDLLDEPRESRLQLRVKNDKNHTYIDGLRYVQINSIYEAYLIYSYGRYNLSVGSTGLNDRSSRSHSIFTITLIGRPSTDVRTYFLHSSLTVCDLAGTERVNRTGNVGQRLREAQRINSSFLTLNRCLRTIRYNQSSGFNRCVPYRESKLTKILGPSLTSSDTSLAMIVTVSQSEDLIEETESSLNASSVAATIKTTSKPPKHCRSGRFSNLVMAEYLNWNDVANKKPSRIDERRKSEESLQELNATSFSRLCSEGCMPDVYKELEDERKKRKLLEEKLTEMEKFYKKEIDRLENKTNTQSSENAIDILQKKIEEHEEDFMLSRTENLKLKKIIREVNEEKTLLNDKIKNLEKTNKGLNEMLDDAKEEVQDLQNEVIDLEKLLKEKEDIILLKDEKLQSLETEILELEQNLENNANEIEAYDKQLMFLEEHLYSKKKEVKTIMDKYELLSERFEKTDAELTRLKEKYEQEKERYSKEVEQTHSIIENYKTQMEPQNYSLGNQSTPEQIPSRYLKSSNDQDGNYIPRSYRKAKTTVKKRRNRKSREHRDFYNSSSASLKSSATFSCRNTSSKQSASCSNKTKKKLFNQSLIEYSTPSDTLTTTNETESSTVSSLFKRTLRSGKLY